MSTDQGPSSILFHLIHLPPHNQNRQIEVVYRALGDNHHDVIFHLFDKHITRVHRQIRGANNCAKDVTTLQDIVNRGDAFYLVQM